jgi:hypothetical protein
MPAWPAIDKSEFLSGARPHGLANQMLADLKVYEFDTKLVEDYSEDVQDQVAHGIRDLRRIPGLTAKLMLRPTQSALRALAVNSKNLVERDQSVWQLAQCFPKTAAETIIESIKTAPSTQMATSGIIALHKLAHLSPQPVRQFLVELDKNAEVEIAEWARLFIRDIEASTNGDFASLAQPVSDRDFVYDPDATFDATMPLIFHCDAYTKIGPTTWHTVVSPTWFRTIFGDAMALIREETYESNLILEKSVPGLHEDGSLHYEHFPFTGETQILAPNIYKHNYWANLHRPFYTSGRTESVSPANPVIRSVPMSFFRMAVTSAPERYRVNGKPLPESVRGMFFGYGHIEPSVLIGNKLDLKAGDFQLTPKQNPETGAPANTMFCGTFFGKVRDVDGDGKLDFNTIPTHCNTEGRLDYGGDGQMAPDPVCPKDWTGLPR